MDSRDILQVLADIRAIQREHLEEYRRVASEQLQLSKLAVERQQQYGRLYQRVVAVAGLLLVGLIIFTAWLCGAIRV